MTLVLVKVKNTYYPHKEDDYQKLKKLGVPLRSIAHTQLDSLLCLLKGQEVEYVPFQLKERAMLDKIEQLWDFDFEQDGADLVFTRPVFSVKKKRDREQTAHARIQTEKLDQVLKKWYARYGIQLDKQLRETRSTNRVTYTRRIA